MKFTNAVMGNMKANRLVEIVKPIIEGGFDEDNIVRLAVKGAITDRNRPFEQSIWSFKASNHPLKAEYSEMEKSLLSILIDEIVEEARNQVAEKEVANEEREMVNHTTISIPKKYQPMLEIIEQDGDGYWAYAREGYEFGGMGSGTAHEYTQADLLAMIRTVRVEQEWKPNAFTK